MLPERGLTTSLQSSRQHGAGTHTGPQAHTHGQRTSDDGAKTAPRERQQSFPEQGW